MGEIIRRGVPLWSPWGAGTKHCPYLYEASEAYPMNRIEVMELVRSYQIGSLNRREFLQRATAVIGSALAANTLLAACEATPNNNPPPVVDESQPAAEPGTETVGALTTGVVTYPGVEGEELMGYLAYQTSAEPRPAVIVIQEWWGLNDHIKDVTRRFAEAGYAALAPDLYHGVVTTEPDEARKQAMELGMRDAVGEIGQAIAYLQAQAFVAGGTGVVGFCMGGGLVYQSAANLSSVDAGAAFYGSQLTAAQAQEVTAPILSFLGTADSISVPGLEAMHAIFDENGITNHYQVYEGAQHSFFNDTRASYDEAAAQDAWQQTLDWFNQYL
ncbi:MAG: dienelactone hydrolase family protein [Ardenticatenaceae bacterium]|nr:dienelactone hydrolase family protein [Ardenticatenaceae bacterium]